MKFFIDTADLDEIHDALLGCPCRRHRNLRACTPRTGGKLADFEDHMVKIAKMCGDLASPRSPRPRPPRHD